MPDEQEQTRRSDLATRWKIFYRNGFNATGMDLVAKETGVSKTSIYKHFRTKDELILAVLRLRDEDFRNWLFRRMEELADSPAGQLLAMFDALEEWFEADGFQGCMFIKASAEFQDKDDAINRQSYAHKELLVDHFARLAEASGHESPRALARELLILKEGAIVIAAMSHNPAPAREAKAIAARILG
ncbi:MAG: TetR/AcrR family transcriptional regulator [Tepidamorphaceae bacterium]